MLLLLLLLLHRVAAAGLFASRKRVPLLVETAPAACRQGRFAFSGRAGGRANERTNQPGCLVLAHLQYVALAHCQQQQQPSQSVSRLVSQPGPERQVSQAASPDSEQASKRERGERSKQTAAAAAAAVATAAEPAMLLLSSMSMPQVVVVVVSAMLLLSSSSPPPCNHRRRRCLMLSSSSSSLYF